MLISTFAVMERFQVRDQQSWTPRGDRFAVRGLKWTNSSRASSANCSPDSAAASQSQTSDRMVGTGSGLGVRVQVGIGSTVAAGTVPGRRPTRPVSHRWTTTRSVLVREPQEGKRDGRFGRRASGRRSNGLWRKRRARRVLDQALANWYPKGGAQWRIVLGRPLSGLASSARFMRGRFGGRVVFWQR